jgi:hypothetical protein
MAGAVPTYPRPQEFEKTLGSLSGFSRNFRSTNIRAEDETRICALAERLDLPLLCNSDAHRAEDVGAYYNVLPRVPRDDQDLVSVLKDGHHQWCGKVQEGTRSS